MSASSTAVRRAFVAAAALAFVAYVAVQVLAAIASRGPGARARELMPVIDAQSVDRELPPDIAAYPLEGPAGDPHAAAFRLGAYPPGTVIFLNFWATWCEPCVRELPSMIALGRELGGRPFVMLAVSYDENWEAIDGFFTRVFRGTPQGMHVARDPETNDERMMRVRMGTQKLPETYVIRDGRVLARFVNARDWVDPAIVEYFERLLESR